MKILITGATGLIGGRLYEYISKNKKSYDVVLTSTSDYKIRKFKNICKIRKINFKSKKNLEKVCQGVDVVIHTAGISSLECENNSKNAKLVHEYFTKNLIEAAYKSGVSKFIYYSTWKVYSDQFDRNFTEDSKIKSKHPYGVTKKLGEDVILEKKYSDKMKVIILRIANGFGSPFFGYVQRSIIINDFCLSAIKNNYISITGDPSTVRFFTPVSDICKVTCLFIQNRSKPYDDQIFNIDVGKHYSLYSIADIVKKRVQYLTSKKTNIIHSNPIRKKNKKNINPTYKSKHLKKINYKYTKQDMRIDIVKEIDKLLYHLLGRKSY